MGPDNKRRHLVRVYQLVALAISLGGLVAAVRNFHGMGPSVAGVGFAVAVILEWVRSDK